MQSVNAVHLLQLPKWQTKEKIKYPGGQPQGIAPLVIDVGANPLWLPPILVLNAIGKRYIYSHTTQPVN